MNLEDDAREKIELLLKYHKDATGEHWPSIPRADEAPTVCAASVPRTSDGETFKMWRRSRGGIEYYLASLECAFPGVSILSTDIGTPCHAVIVLLLKDSVFLAKSRFNHVMPSFDVRQMPIIFKLCDEGELATHIKNLVTCASFEDAVLRA